MLSTLRWKKRKTWHFLTISTYNTTENPSLEHVLALLVLKWIRFCCKMQFELNNMSILCFTLPLYNFPLSHGRVQIYINLLFMFVAPFFNLLIIRPWVCTNTIQNEISILDKNRVLKYPKNAQCLDYGQSELLHNRFIQILNFLRKKS